MEITSWKILEDEILRELKIVQSKQNALVKRHYDTKSAGNLIPAQEADFSLLYEGKFCFIEAKYSNKFKSLRSCFSKNVSTFQTASAELTYRAGGKYYFVFYSFYTKEFEVWPGDYCAYARKKGAFLSMLNRKAFPTLKAVIDYILSDMVSESQ